MDPIFSRSETHRSGAQDMGDEAEVSEGIMVNQTRFLHPSKSLSAVKLEEVSPHGLNTRATGCLGTPEKVVGSFLFLRFLIPAITSPDTYGLVDSRPSASARRGLILSGKVLTALCNDIEFSTKESYLMSMNDFLRDHRDVVKEYLSYAACDDHTPPPPTDPPRQEKKSFHLKDTLKNDLNPRRKALSASMPSLNISSLDLSKPDAPHTPKLTRHFRPGPPKLEPSRSSSTLRLGSSSSRIDITDLDELFTHIGHSIDVIEKEIEERVDGMGVGEAEGVVANFFEMKRLVEMSPYGRKGDGGEGGFGKAGVVLAKWSKSIKGIFVSKSRSQSTHDLTVS
ncbi:hypothetical protein BC829DRAFT_404335 [Chytridium lagenaria]|nr:hypothetical protein BC829DRAFT_404335 [Chytridium lagenaria]